MIRILAILLLLSTCLKAQQPVRVFTKTGEFNFQTYEIYPDGKLIKLLDCNQTPLFTIEGLMQQIICGDSQEKIDRITLGGAKKSEKKTIEDFEKIRKSNKEKTYFKLLSRLDFKSKSEELCILKFKLFIEQAPQGVTGAYQLQKVGNRWYKTSRTDLSNIALMMMFIKPHVFSDLLAGKPKNQKEFDALLTKVYENKGLNFEKLYNEFSLWENDKEKTALFTEPAW